MKVLVFLALLAGAASLAAAIAPGWGLVAAVLDGVLAALLLAIADGLRRTHPR